MFEQADFEIIWTTGPKPFLPHFKTCQQFNPTIKQHINVNAPSKTYREGWRNPDKGIREFWQQNSNKIKTQKVILLEYDTYVNQKIELLFPIQGVAGRDVWQLKTSAFPFFSEIVNMPRQYQRFAVAIAPLAVTLWDREALDGWADSVHDEIYSLDLFSELRLATCIASMGLPVLHAQGLHNANYMKREVNEGPGIYHAIKKPVEK